MTNDDDDDDDDDDDEVIGILCCGYICMSLK